MGNLFSNNKYLFEEYKLHQPNFDFYINIIKSFNNNIKLKDDAINKIKDLENQYHTNWSKYDLESFNKIDYNTIIHIISIRKNMSREYTHKCSDIYDELINKLDMKNEIDNTIYKS